MGLFMGSITYEDYLNTGTNGSEPIYVQKKTCFSKIRYGRNGPITIPNYKVIIVKTWIIYDQ